MTTIRWRLSSAGLPDRWEFQPSLRWPLAEEWQIRFKRGQEIEEIGNKIYVGLIVDFFLIKGSLTKQLDGVQTVEDLYRISLGGEGARDRAWDFHELVDEAAEKWLTHTFLQGHLAEKLCEAKAP